MANDKQQYLSRDGVSHLYLLIKNKLTTYFKTIFVSKKDGYDLSQNDFTNELKTKLENMSSSGGGGGSGTNDYNDLLNRPVYGEAFYSYFDGNETPNPDTFNVLTSTFYKVSDLTPTKEQLYSATLSFNGFAQDEELSDANIFSTFEKDGKIVVIAFTLSEGNRIIAVVYSTDTTDGIVQGYPVTISAPSVGIYWGLTDGVANKTFEIEYGEGKQLDDIYIPKNIPRLNSDGVLLARYLPIIPAEKLPSYVDDVIEGYYDVHNYFWETYSKDESGNEHWADSIIPETGKIYLDLLTNSTYRWSGSQYVKIESSAGLTALTNTEIDEIIASVDSSIE